MGEHAPEDLTVGLRDGEVHAVLRAKPRSLPGWADEDTPVFDGLAAEWAMKGRELPDEIAALTRVPPVALDMLADAGERRAQADVAQAIPGQRRQPRRMSRADRREANARRGQDHSC